MEKNEKIHDFLDIDQDEENEIMQERGLLESISYPCNLEELIKPDKEISDLGQNSIIVLEIDEFKN